MLRVLCTQRFLWVWIRHFPHSTWMKRLRVPEVRTWVTSRRRRGLASFSGEKTLATLNKHQSGSHLSLFMSTSGMFFSKLWHLVSLSVSFWDSHFFCCGFVLLAGWHNSGLQESSGGIEIRFLFSPHLENVNFGAAWNGTPRSPHPETHQKPFSVYFLQITEGKFSLQGEQTRKNEMEETKRSHLNLPFQNETHSENSVKSEINETTCLLSGC